MTIRSGQRLYRVRGPDGKWVKKGDGVQKIIWVDDEHQATFWRKLHHLKAAVKEGIFSEKGDWRDDFALNGLPISALKVYEYEAVITRTDRVNRLSELQMFHEEVPEKTCEHTCKCGYSSITSSGMGRPGVCGECDQEV